MNVDPVLAERLAKLLCPYCRAKKPLQKDGFHVWATVDGDWVGSSRVGCERPKNRMVIDAFAQVATAYAELKAAEGELSEAEWWEHLVGWGGDCDPGCMYCVRFRKLRAAVEAAKAKWEGCS
jgi:hypothetical protein